MLTPLYIFDSQFVRSNYVGIKKSGTSHLLLTRDQAQGFTRTRGTDSLNIRGNPLSAQDFESLSPISFDTVDALNKKMSSLKPKAGKNHQRDTSQANRIYDFGGIEIYRGAFEHGRCVEFSSFLSVVYLTLDFIQSTLSNIERSY